MLPWLKQQDLDVPELWPGTKSMVIEGDCLQIMPHLPNGSVNLVLCDLPYGTTQNAWDSAICLQRLWAQYERILAPRGAIILMGQGPFTANLIVSRPDLFKYKIVWIKSKATNFLNAKKQPLRRHGDICVFYPGQTTYNPVMTSGEAYDKGIRKDQLTGSYGTFSPVRVKSAGKRYPGDVYYHKTAESEGPVWHATQKPVSLGRYLIRTYSNPGNLVLDNASGSGSFLVAAAVEGRNSIGIELNHAIQAFKMEPVDLMQVTADRLKRYLSAENITRLSSLSMGDNALRASIMDYVT